MFLLVVYFLKWFYFKMKAEIEQFKEESSQQEKNNNSRLRDIDRQREKTESSAEDYERQTSVISKILDDVRAGRTVIVVVIVFSKTKTKKKPTKNRVTHTQTNKSLSFLFLPPPTAISSTLKTTQCDCSALEDALGSSAGITESNIMSYMSLVEQKTIELLAIRAYLESKVTRCQLVAQFFSHTQEQNVKLSLFSSLHRMLRRTTIPKSLLNLFWDSIQNS